MSDSGTGDTPEGRARREDILNTYRYLRLGMAVLLGLLAAAVVGQVFFTPPTVCFQTSVSAYFYTPVKGAFVAALCAIGTGLIVYKGNTRTEDILLNFTGVAAFVVAFVPTGLDNTCKRANDPLMVLTEIERNAVVRNNMWALLVIGLATILLLMRFNPTQFKIRSWRAHEKSWLAVTVALQVIAALLFLFRPAYFKNHGHRDAAIALFVGMVLVALTNAYSYAREKNPGSPGYQKYRNRYAGIAAAMIVTIIIGGVIYFAKWWSHIVFALEAVVILEFGIFWGVQTAELWNEVKRSEPCPLNSPACPLSSPRSATDDSPVTTVS